MKNIKSILLIIGLTVALPALLTLTATACKVSVTNRGNDTWIDGAPNCISNNTGGCIASTQTRFTVKKGPRCVDAVSGLTGCSGTNIHVTQTMQDYECQDTTTGCQWVLVNTRHVDVWVGGFLATDTTCPVNSPGQ